MSNQPPTMIKCIKPPITLTRSLPPKSNHHHHHLLHTRTLATDLETCSTLPHLLSIQSNLFKTNALQDSFLLNQFITLSSSLNNLPHALSLFPHATSPNTFVYNALIRGLVNRSSSPIKALEFYIDMLRANLCPTSYTFSSLVKACGVVGANWFGKGVHSQVLRAGFGGHVFVMTALVEFYGGFGVLGDARKVFDEMSERDVFAWTTMVLVYTRRGEMGAARGVFEGLGERSVAAWNGMVDGYARLGEVEEAAVMFDRMPVRDLISWTMMIACYSRSKRYKEALCMFEGMMSDGVCPDGVTLATVISCCAHMGALELGRRLHYCVVEGGYGIDVYIGSALIDMYAKCGSLERALVVFYNLEEKNIFCWNSVIEGLAVHGRAKDALNMFNGMLKEGIKPNGVTFISILSACTHAGLVSEGRKLFKSMTLDFSIAPQIEHYGCIVDLLCRARLLEDALEVIRSMEVEPNSVVWGALLSGCKRCRNLEIAEIAVSKLMVLEPNNCGYYNLLINMYAEANRWTEVLRIRATMKELGMEKECPGSSWIELENEVHQFAASDKCHPNSNEIFCLLDELDGVMKLVDKVSEFKSAV